MLGQILLGTIIISIGGITMYFANQISDIFGYIEFAEKYLGGTRNGILLLGFIIMIIGFSIMFGIFSPNTGEVGLFIT